VHNWNSKQFFSTVFLLNVTERTQCRQTSPTAAWRKFGEPNSSGLNFGILWTHCCELTRSFPCLHMVLEWIPKYGMSGNRVLWMQRLLVTPNRQYMNNWTLIGRGRLYEAAMNLSSHSREVCVLVVWRTDELYLPTHIAISHKLTIEQLLIISLTIEIEKKKTLIAKILFQSEMTFRYLPFKAQRSLQVPLDVT